MDRGSNVRRCRDRFVFCVRFRVTALLWKTIVFVAVLAVADSASADVPVVDVADTDSVDWGQQRSRRDVAVAPSEPGKYEIEYTAFNFADQYPYTFPDIDYAFMGYDLLKGFPLAIGHDPGFTRPIFIGEYNYDQRTADYLWQLPTGVAAVPDVSCVTSFSSEVSTSMRSFAMSLSASVGVSGGGWGFQFSASVGYQEASSAVSSGKYVLIVSKASCDYYFMRLLDDTPPPFHPGFVKWAIKLNNTELHADYLKFFEKYGTHFVKEATFGASFTYEHKMSASAYESASSSGLDVSLAASYSGLFNLGLEAKLSTEQKQAAADFNSKVTTKTITRGAPPPANGDALTWASTVKDSPLPVRYGLTSIEGLFSEKFMGPKSFMAQYNIDYNKIRTSIAAAKRDYCRRLQSEGLVDDCTDYISALTLTSTKLGGTPARYTSISSYADCVELCYELAECDAVSFCTKCSSSDTDYQVCQVYTADSLTWGASDFRYETIVRVHDMKETAVLATTDVSGVERALSSNVSISSVYNCSVQCAKDEFCVAFSFCNCPKRKQRCKLYSDVLYHLGYSSDSTLYFLPPGVAAYDPTTGEDIPTESDGGGTDQENRNIKVNDYRWAGSSCSSDSDCTAAGTVCVINQCLCPLDKSYSISQDTCVSPCQPSDWAPGMMGPYHMAPSGVEKLDGFPDRPQEDCYKACSLMNNCHFSTFDYFLYCSFYPAGGTLTAASDFLYYQKVCK